MFPHANHLPAGLSEAAIGISITPLRCCDLCLPPLSVRLWPDDVVWAAMPKATIDIHGEPDRRKDNVRPPTQAR